MDTSFIAITIIVLGVILFVLGSKARGSMTIKVGEFKGPVWFLIIVIGIFIWLLGPLF